MILSCVNINTLQRTAFLVDKKNCFLYSKSSFLTVGSLMLIVKKRSFQSLYLTINLFPRLMIRPNRLISWKSTARYNNSAKYLGPLILKGES